MNYELRIKNYELLRLLNNSKSMTHANPAGLARGDFSEVSNYKRSLHPAFAELLIEASEKSVTMVGRTFLSVRIC